VQQSISGQFKRLIPLVEELREAEGWQNKLAILNRQENVKSFFQSSSPVLEWMEGLAPECEVVLKAVIAIGQAPHILSSGKWPSDGKSRLQALIEQLLAIEKFYHEIGGVVGYHWMVLQFLDCQRSPSLSQAEVNFHPPRGTDISEESEEVLKAILWGIEHIPVMAEIYPLGGAADRLRLYDEATGIPLPAARLRFAGKTLLEHLVLDLEAREYLYYKLYGTQCVVPIAMMMSPEKENQAHIQAICEEKEWFGRPKESFCLFSQPLVPTINNHGNWCTTGPMKLLMKPGGHGVIWKLARDAGIFSWLGGLGKKKALIRQINNPIAGTDYGLLAFFGIGCKQDKAFGFASCERQVKASEGVNVLVERKTDQGIEYVLTNIEYCDFSRYGIKDEPKDEDGTYSKFPSNTNILFADLNAVEKASLKAPMPGLLINLKKTSFLQENGRWKEEEIARLESTMQNIADHFALVEEQVIGNQVHGKLPAYLTFNERRKTISTTKREFSLGSSLLETPEGCFLDCLRNAHELLHDHCRFKLPDITETVEFFVKGPPFLFFYHPALGPLYRIIGQKIRKGKMNRSAELQLDLAELDMENLDLKGSLIIEATDPVGRRDAQGILRFDKPGGRCQLYDITIRNRGIDRQAHQTFWRNEIVRKECCKIVLHGMAEFCARSITLSGDVCIEVEDGYRVTAFQGEKEVEFLKEKIDKPSWQWKYSIENGLKIALSKD